MQELLPRSIYLSSMYARIPVRPPWTGSRRVSARCHRFMSVVNNGFMRIHWHRDMDCVSPLKTRHIPTYTDVGNADIAGAYICHPWGLEPRIRPPRTVEVQVLQEQKPALRDTVFGGDTQFISLIFVEQQCFSKQTTWNKNASLQN